jgi:hypothetical protein
MDEEHVILSGKWGKRQRRIYKWDCELISLLLHAVAMNHYVLADIEWGLWGVQ